MVGGRVGGRALADRRAVPLVMAGVFAVAVLPVAIYLSRPAGLYGVTQYDDGVYFSASLRLIQGIFPYRDFVLVQPPGIAEVLAPFAALSHVVGERHAIGLARAFTGAVEGANAALVVYLLRRRGLLAAGFGGLLVAVFPPAFAADHTFLLEPFLDLACLVGIALVFSGEDVASTRRVALGGVAFAVAGAIKTFAIVPFALVLLVLLVARRRQVVPFLAGALVAGAVLILPFFLAAPHAFVHDVISSQVGRTTQRPTPAVNRIYALVGLSYASSSAALSLPRASGLVWTVGAVVAALLAASVLLSLFGRRSSLYRRALALAALGVTATTFVPAAYYDHYALFSAVFLALALGDGAGRLVGAVRARLGALGRGREVRRRVAGAGTAVVLAVGAGLVLQSSVNYNVTARVDKFGDPGPAIAATVPSRGCVLSDSASLLMSADRAGPGPSGCPALVDATGTWLSIDALNPPENSGAEPKPPALVAQWRAMLARADYVVLSGVCAFRIPWTPALYAYFDTHFSKLAGPYGLAFRRAAPTDAAEQPALETRCVAARAAREAA